MVVVNITTTADVTEMLLSNVPLECENGQNYLPIDLAAVHQLSSGDGSKDVHVCVRDEAGNTKSLGDEIILDTTEPIAAPFRNGGLSGIRIDGDASVSAGGTVNLTIRADDPKDENEDENTRVVG